MEVIKSPVTFILICLSCGIEGAAIFNYWTSWSTWGSCTVTCSRGAQYRTRTCVGGLPGSLGCENRWWEARGCILNFSCFTVPTTTTSTTTTTTRITATTEVTTTQSPDTSCMNPTDRNSYRGQISRTISGYTCQRWDSQFPHPHDFTPQKHPQSGLEDNNYCRNPDLDERPWCFTSNPKKQWDYCEVAICTENNGNPAIIPDNQVQVEVITGTCFNASDLQSYTGSISITDTGIECQNWNSSFPHKNLFPRVLYDAVHLGNHNFCRNPDNDSKPWCFTTDPSISWAYCDVPLCSEYENEDISTAINMNGECGRPSIEMTSNQADPVPFVPMFASFNQPRAGLLGGFMSEGLVSEGGYEETSENIAGGFETTHGSIPWQASIRRTYSGSHFCGGSLISQEWILTAAHCITQPQNPSSYFAVLGDHNQYIMDLGQKRVDIARIFRHEGYSSTTLNNDITLMKTTIPVEFTDKISPVCLPSIHSIPEKDDTLIVSGWGTMQVTGSNEVLHQATVPLVRNDECRRLMGAVTSAMMCAGYKDGGEDSCQGDSGGPLVSKLGGHSYTVVGIVSWGYGCAEENKPVVYTRVSNYMNWISGIIN